MWLRIVHYCTALVTLTALSVVYQNLITPLLEPPPVEAIAMASRSIVRVDRSLHSLFPDGAWQRGNCRELKTSNMTLLFRDYEQQADDRLSLRPVTVIVGHGLSTERDANPIIIHAQQGAEITFTEPINVLGTGGKAPAIRGGRIAGEVRIQRAAGDRHRAFDLRTSNIGIGSKKIWTTDAIALQVGGATCSGRDLTIHLVAAATQAQGDAVLDRMELIYLDRLEVPIPSTAGKAPALVSVNCDGRLEYDFAIDVLSLYDAVSLRHQVPSQPPDEFHCDRLTVHLNDPINQSIKRESPLDWINEIAAEGSPAAAVLPSMDAEVIADSIRLQGAKGLLEARGKAGVQARFGGVSARLANLYYQFDTQAPERLGAIDVQGAGIVRVRDDQIPLRKLQWRDRFALFPVAAAGPGPHNGEFELQIDGELQAWLEDGGEIQADSLTGYLIPETDSSADPLGNLIPERFVASGKVRIDTPAIAADTDELFVEFVADPPSPNQPDGAQPAKPDSARAWTRQPPATAPMTPPVARPRPVVRGDAINAQLTRTAAGLSPTRLSVVGNVSAQHEITTAGQTLPVTFAGERLQLVQTGIQDVIQIVGSARDPARFDFGDGFFIGPEIQIWPTDNLVAIDSAGEFRMPTAALPQPLADPSQPPLRWTSPPHCRWSGAMRFDGRTALLTGGIEITAALVNDEQPWELALSGDRLRIDLQEGVQVRDVQTVRQASILAVSLLRSATRPVLVQAIQRAADGVVESKHLLSATKFTYSPAGGGALVGAGPGWYRNWMAATPSLAAGPVATASPALNRPAPLTGVHLTFTDAMRGDLTSRTLDFLRGVRVGVRPVNDWDQAFDASAMDRIAAGESTLDCEQLRIAVAPGLPPPATDLGLPTPWEVEAQRGVVFRTRSETGLISGTANRAVYDSSKQLFTAEGIPNQPAVVQRTDPQGKLELDLAVRTTTIHLGSMRIMNLVPERLVIPPRPQ